MNSLKNSFFLTNGIEQVHPRLAYTFPSLKFSLSILLMGRAAIIRIRPSRIVKQIEINFPEKSVPSAPKRGSFASGEI